MKFRPCIDIHNGKVKQIVGGSLTNDSSDLVENFVSDKDSSYYAELFKSDRLSGGHIIMLGPGNEQEALKALHVYPSGMQIGGGVTAENASSYIEQGASHVIVTSYVFRDGNINFDNLNRIVSEIGKDKLVLDLSCRKKDHAYYVVTDRWQKFTDFKINEQNINELSKYCNEFLVHAADVEGKCNGIQEDLVKSLGQWVKIPTTYAGGARSLDDLALIKKLGQNKLDFTIGSALDIFGGSLPYNKVVKWCKDSSI